MTAFFEEKRGRSSPNLYEARLGTSGSSFPEEGKIPLCLVEASVQLRGVLTGKVSIS